jgi:NitT/TauT family transport system substrate-binding protein
MTIQALGRPIILAMLAVTALAVAGCGGDEAGGSAQTKLTVQVVPVYDVAPIYLGIEKGFFAEQDLELEIQTAQGGPETIPQVLDGGVQIGYSNTPSLLTAAARGLPIEIIAPAGRSPGLKQGNGENLEGAVMVTEGSSIRTYADLEGKTVAVNTLANVGDLTLNATLEKHGVDHTTVEYVEVPFPDMLGALDAGRVDAAVVVSPFKTIAEQSRGFRSVVFPILETRPELVYTGYFVSRNWAADNKRALERFRLALHKSLTYAATHERETRETIAEFTELPKEIVPRIPIADHRPDCEGLRTSSELLVRLMVEYGVLDGGPDLDDLIRPGFCGR